MSEGITLNVPQDQFLRLPHKYRLFVAGFGSGKTFVACTGGLQFALEHPKTPFGYFGPSFPHIRDIFYPTIQEVAEKIPGMSVKIKRADHEVDVYYGGRYRSTCICRSMDKPDGIVGFKIGHALVDEMDVLRQTQAETAWRKIIARMRVNDPTVRNGIDVATTPEGFKFVYSQWVKQVREKPGLADLYGMVQASTYQNEQNLPDDYIDSLRASYPPQLIEAYLRGQFVNLTAGSVYPDFDRRASHTDDEVKPGDVLHVGMDFNVLKMAAVVCVVRDGEPHAVAELTDVRDTPTMARMLKERYAGHQIVVYPDASGQNTSSKNASESDLSILRQNGFHVRVNSRNPAVKDRVSSVNALILNDKGLRRFKVNTRLCPTVTECLEQQAYDKNGEPDKTTGHDHANDALGYFLVHEWPVAARNMRLVRTTGT